MMEPPTSLGAFLAPAARYVPEQIKARTPYGTGKICVECGGVHDRTHITYCGEVTADGEIVSGCAGVVGRRVERVLFESRGDVTDEERDHLDRTTRLETSGHDQLATEDDIVCGKNSHMVTPLPPPGPTPPINCAENILTWPELASGTPTARSVEHVALPAAEQLLWRLTAGPLWSGSAPDGEAVNICACGAVIPPGRKWTCRLGCYGTA